MGVIHTTLDLWEFNRKRTLSTLDEVAGLPDPAAALGWRPGPGRAPIAWQLMHIAITEELFATERLTSDPVGYPVLVPRFRGGSVPDYDTPSIDEIRDVLAGSREHLLATIHRFQDDDLSMIPGALRERGWSLGTVLQVLTWHEPHHQGQAHITLNLFKAAHI